MKFKNIDYLHDMVELINAKVLRTSRRLPSELSPPNRHPNSVVLSEYDQVYVELMLAEAELGDPEHQYLYIGMSEFASETVQKWFYKRLCDEQIKCTMHPRRKIIILDGPTFHFRGLPECLGSRPFTGTINRIFCGVDLREKSVDYIARVNGEFSVLLATDGDIV